MNFTNKFYGQDTIQYEVLERDIKLWREELEGIREEIHFITYYLESTENKSNQEINFEKSHLHLNVKRLENEVFLSRLNNFSVKLEGMNECDDIPCETFYINDFVDFKLQIESFLSEYRKLKKNIFVKVNSRTPNKDSF